MRIDCPSCAASYEVSDHLLAGRKTVRCARCGRDWAPASVSPALVSDVAVPPEGFLDPPRPGLDEVEPAPPPDRFSSPGLRLAWAASVLVLLAGLAAAVFWHDRIARAWPPSLRVYAALGLAHNAR